MSQAENKVQWGAEEYTSPPAYLESRKSRRFDVSDARLTPLIKQGKEEFGTWKKVGGAYKSMVSSSPKFWRKTSGLDFCGPLAFVGLSQVRESMGSCPFCQESR